MQLDALAIVGLDDPRVDLAVGHLQDRGLEAFRDLLVRIDHGFEQVFASLVEAAARQIGTNFAAVAIDLVAAAARDFAATEEDFFASNFAATCQGFAVVAEMIVRLASRIERSDLLQHGLRRARLRGIEQVELYGLGRLALGQSHEPLVEDGIGVVSLERRERADCRLLLGDRVARHRFGQQRDRTSGIARDDLASSLAPQAGIDILECFIHDGFELRTLNGGECLQRGDSFGRRTDHIAHDVEQQRLGDLDLVASGQFCGRFANHAAPAEERDHHRLHGAGHVNRARLQRTKVAKNPIQWRGRVPIEQLGNRFDAQRVVEQWVSGERRNGLRVVERAESKVGVHHATQQRIGQPRFVGQFREGGHRVGNRHVMDGSRRFENNERLGIVEEGRDSRIGLPAQGEDRAESLGG